MSHTTSNMREFWRSYGWLLMMTALVTVFTSVYLLADVRPSLPAQLTMSFTLPICFFTWVETDARLRRCTPCYDFGLFLLLFGGCCISIPIYLIWTRGAQGILVAIMFFVLWLLPSVIYLFLWLLVTIVAG